MKKLLLFIFAAFLTVQVFGQTNKVWVRFRDAKTGLTGYKDLKGVVKVPAKFESWVTADSFYNIIAVSESSGDASGYYYLLKDGTKRGRDSVFMSDFTPDCESEGKILFGDWKQNRVGFLAKNGVVIIPAVYNSASRFRNGMAVALHNAKRKCWGEKDTLRCEHWGWEGGQRILINEQNEVLADSLPEEITGLNWYSKSINRPIADTGISVAIKGRHGITYWFVDYEKEFRRWFDTVFSTALRNGKTDAIKQFVFSEIIYWSKQKGWTSVKQSNVAQAFPKLLTAERFAEDNLKRRFIGTGEFNTMIFEKAVYRKFFTACGEHNTDKFPAFSVVMAYYKERTEPLSDSSMFQQSNRTSLMNFGKNYTVAYQEHFTFIRTENTYKLLQVSVEK